MSFNIGLKLWSTNIDYYFDEAKRLYQDGIFDYIELYVVPDTLQNINKWKTLDIPFTLHAPHFMHDLNLANSNSFEYNQTIYTQVEEYRQVLNAKYTIVHAGIQGNIEETVRQLKIISPINMFIENKPYIAPLADNKLCRGATIEEIKYVLCELTCGFCLDIGHAICSANSQNLEPYQYVSSFNSLKPNCYHLSGGFIDSSIDQHLHLFEGTFDYKKIVGIIDKNKDISIETSKDSKENLNDFIEDVQCVKNLL